MRSFLALVVLLAGCSDGPPTCKQAVASLEKNLEGTGLRVYVTGFCESDNYSGNVRRCLSIAKSGHALEKCADAHMQDCITKARGREMMMDQCKSELSLRGLVEEAASSSRLDRDKALSVIGDYNRAFDRWTEAHPDKRCPPSLEDLEVTITEPGIASRRIDPWGSDYVMTCDAKDFRVTSFGPDKQQGTTDDVPRKKR